MNAISPKHANVALFIPFNGCPHKCSFCDQRSITGKTCQPSPEDVRAAIETALDSLKENSINSEIAFFGGSFTAIDRAYMVSLLEAAAPYIDRFRGIRISTRPDCIDPEILALLKGYGVTSIELGAQSMSDEVLSANDRGHTADDAVKASGLIRESGFELGLQMMTGLYKSSDELDVFTAERFIELRPETVRIYPTIVMRGTQLGELYQAGVYAPQELEPAVGLCARLVTLFEQNGVRVIRVGLHDTDTLRRDMLAGPYHPAFRELCESRIMLDKAVSLLSARGRGEYTLLVSPKSRSKMTGNKKSNIAALKELGYEVTIAEDDNLGERDIVIN